MPLRREGTTCLDGFKALMTSGGDNLMLMDSRSPKKHMTRSTGINDVESSHCSHGPVSQVEVDVARSEGRFAPKI